MQEGEDTWEDDSSMSELSSTYGPHRPDVGTREFNNPHFASTEYPDDYCEEVQCVEMEESSRDNSDYLDLSRSNNGMLALQVSGEGNIAGQETLSPVNGNSEAGQIQANSTYGALEQRLHDVQSSVDSLVCPMSSNSRSVKLTRSWSCTEHLMTGSPERFGEIESTPANGFLKGFLGRPEGLRKRFPPLIYGDARRLSRNDSQSSIGTPSRDELRVNSVRESADEDITSVQTFVAGMKEMVKHEYGKQLVDGRVRINILVAFINIKFGGKNTMIFFSFIK